MYEGKAFPSDAVSPSRPDAFTTCGSRLLVLQYAFASQIALHDYPPSSLLPVDPLPGEFNIRTEEILKIIEEQGDTIAIMSAATLLRRKCFVES